MLAIDIVDLDKFGLLVTNLTLRLGINIPKDKGSPSMNIDITGALYFHTEFSM